MTFLLSLLFAFTSFTLAAVLPRSYPGYSLEASSTSTSQAASPTGAAMATPFAVIAARSTSPIHLRSVNAAQGAFFIGQSTNSYCPPEYGSGCINGSYTAFIVNNGACSLDAQVPGGQSVFVLPNGELGFTEPHSGAYPAGAVTTGFVETPGSTYATFGFTGLGATGFVACPTVNNTGPYQVYAQVTGFIPSNSNDCIGFDTIAYTPTGPGAFEYL